MDVVTFLELQAELREGKIHPYYIFVGDNAFLKKQYVRKVLSTFEDVSTARELVSKLSQRSLFRTAGGYVLTDVAEATELDPLKVGWKLESPTIFIFNELSPVGALWDGSTDNEIVEFPILDRGRLIKHVQARVPNLPYAISQVVVDLCEQDLARIEVLCHQLKHYGGDITSEVLEVLINDDMRDPKEDLMLAWLDGHPEEIISYLDDVGPDELFRMLAQLYAVTRQALQVELFPDKTPEEIGRLTDVTERQAYRWQKYRVVFTVEELVERLLWVQALEGSVRTGALTKDQAWHWLIAHWFK